MIESARSEEFTQKYKEIYGRVPNKYAESSYDLTMMTAHAQLNKGNMTTREYLLSKEQTGFAKKYSFDQNGDIQNLNWSVIKLK